MMNCRSILPICVVALVLCVCVSAESPESAANSVAADVASLDTRLAQVSATCFRLGSYLDGTARCLPYNGPKVDLMNAFASNLM